MSFPHRSVGDYYSAYKLIGGSLVTSRVTRNSGSCDSGQVVVGSHITFKQPKKRYNDRPLIFAMKCATARLTNWRRVFSVTCMSTVIKHIITEHVMSTAFTLIKPTLAGKLAGADV